MKIRIRSFVLLMLVAILLDIACMWLAMVEYLEASIYSWAIAQLVLIWVAIGGLREARQLSSDVKRIDAESDEMRHIIFPGHYANDASIARGADNLVDKGLETTRPAGNLIDFNELRTSNQDPDSR